MTQTKTTSPPTGPEDDAPPPAPRLVAALRGAVGDVPYDAVDWTAMHRCIVGDAAGLLWRRQRRPWFSTIARWSPVAIPCGVAVALAAAFVLVASPAPETGGGEGGGAVSPTIVISAVAAPGADARDWGGLTAGLTGALQVDSLLSELVP